MKTKRFLIAISFLVGFNCFSIAQDADECMRFKAIAGNAYKVQDFEKVTSNYIKALKECGELDMIFYNPFIYSIKQSMNRTSEDSDKSAYLDTLMFVYETAQASHGMQIEWQTDIGFNYLKVGTDEAMKKADTAYMHGIYAEKEKVNKGYLQQYYLNIYNLWVKENDKDIKNEYKKRIISEYFILSDYVNKGEMGANITDFLTSLLNRVVTDCEAILPEINNFMKDLPQEIESKKATVKNFMTLLEDKSCTNSNEYAMLIDTIISIDPSADAVLAKAKLQLSQGNNTAAINTFREALSMIKTSDEKSDIELEIARIYYRIKNYNAAHNAGIAVSGKNARIGYEIAANSVSALMNDCGVTTFERKANNYYAVELAEKSGNSVLVNSMKAKCPTSSDIFNADKSVGESVTLSCWNKTYTIQTY